MHEPKAVTLETAVLGGCPCSARTAVPSGAALGSRGVGGVEERSGPRAWAQEEGKKPRASPKGGIARTIRHEKEAARGTRDACPTFRGAAARRVPSADEWAEAAKRGGDAASTAPREIEDRSDRSNLET